MFIIDSMMDMILDEALSHIEFEKSKLYRPHKLELEESYILIKPIHGYNTGHVSKTFGGFVHGIYDMNASTIRKFNDPEWFRPYTFDVNKVPVI